MKNMRGLVITGLLGLTAGAWGSYLNEVRGNINAYQEAYEAGIVAEEDKLYERAVGYYKECMIYKDSMELQAKIFENLKALYQERRTYGDRKNLEVFVNQMMERYPRAAVPYEWAADYYQTEKNWNAVIQLVKKAANLGVHSEILDLYEAQVKYKYEINYAVFAEVKELTEELYAVRDDSGWCYITRKGKTYVNGPFEFATPFFNNRACVKSGGQVYIVNDEGEKQQILASDIEQADFVDDRIFPVKSSEAYYFLDAVTGERIGEYQYAGRYKDGIAAVLINEEWWIIDEENRKISPYAYEDVLLSPTGSCYSDSFVIAKKDGRYQFLNKELKPSLNFTCEELDFCRENVFAFADHGIWGFANLDGTVVLEPEYEAAKSFSNGLAAVRNNGKWGFINEAGNLVIDCEFDDAGYFNDQGYCFVKQDEAWSLLRLLDWE